MYDVNYFIRKFEAIPENLWCVDNFHMGGKCCAMGHCVEVGEFRSAELAAMTNIFSALSVTQKILPGKRNRYYPDYNLKDWVIAPINNGDTNEYQQPTPKQRILAALYDIKKMQEPQHTDITKQLAVLPVNETSDLITTNILQ